MPVIQHCKETDKITNINHTEIVYSKRLKIKKKVSIHIEGKRLSNRKATVKFQMMV